MDETCRAFKTKQDTDTEAAAQKLLASVRKRLAQIARLEARRTGGHALDWQQELKLAQAAALERAQSALQDGEAAACDSTI